VSYLRIRDVSVQFPIYQGSSRSLKKSLLSASAGGQIARDARDRFTVNALKKISLEIEHGQRVALVGANGSGKTTLLKVFAGVYEPTSGVIEVEGSVSALLDPNAGFNPDATGRENIVMRGMFMGMRPREIERHLVDIAEFTGLGDYLEMPSRTYSAGMTIRLAFATSTCVRPDILLMDEWLAAGDAQFMAAAQKRMADFVQDSSILVLASHSMPLLKEWCDIGVLLERGEVKMIDDVDRVIEAYEQKVADQARVLQDDR